MGRGKSAVRPILKNMRPAIAILTVSILIGPVVAGAQSQTPPTSPQTLADLARAEEARRKNVPKATRVYTNTDLKPDTSVPRPTPPQVLPASPETTVPAVNLPGGTVSPEPPAARDEAFWRGRMSTAQAALERTRVLAAAMQSRINGLTTDFVNRDDPAQRAVIDSDRKTALAELDRLKAETGKLQAEIVAIEDEARRAGVPAGWLRPGV